MLTNTVPGTKNQDSHESFRTAFLVPVIGPRPVLINTGPWNQEPKIKIPEKLLGRILVSTCGSALSTGPNPSAGTNMLSENLFLGILVLGKDPVNVN